LLHKQGKCTIELERLDEHTSIIRYYSLPIFWVVFTFDFWKIKR
jgi:hypothetical protein